MQPNSMYYRCFCYMHRCLDTVFQERCQVQDREKYWISLLIAQFEQWCHGTVIFSKSFVNDSTSCVITEYSYFRRYRACYPRPGISCELEASHRRRLRGFWYRVLSWAELEFRPFREYYIVIYLLMWWIAIMLMWTARCRILGMARWVTDRGLFV